MNSTRKVVAKFGVLVVVVALAALTYKVQFSRNDAGLQVSQTQPSAQQPGTPLPPGFAFDPTPQGPGAKQLPTGAAGTNQVVDPTLGGAGDPDEGFDTGDKTGRPMPQNPVLKVIEGGRIKMLVGAPREFGHRIGDVVPVRVQILTDDAVLLDFSSLLKQRVLGFQGADFVLARENAVQMKAMKKGHQVLYVIDLNVQTFVNREPGVAFTLDLRYATGFAGESTTPDWKVMTTGEFLVTRSNTVDNGESLLEGDLSPQPSPSPWLVWPMLVVGFFLVGLWPGLIVVRFLNRIRPGRKVPENEIAWKKFDKAIADANEFGWDVRHYKQIASALRIYLGVAPHTRLEVFDRLSGHKQIELIKSALTKCDLVIYEQHTPTAAENRELVREVKALVPKPE